MTAEVRRRGTTVTIHDPGRYPDFDPVWFDRDWWLEGGARRHSTTGRGSVLMLDRGDETWVYRHYHRGGLVSRLIYDQYFFTGAERSRPLREWRLLAALTGLDLPAPRPVAARAVRAGSIYRADILTVLLPGTRPLSSVLGEVWSEQALWLAIGRMVAAFHAAGCDHPDLTAHNILVDGNLKPWLVDFDNARFRPAGDWSRAGLARLQRSLRKVSGEIATEYDDGAWQWLLRAYADYRA